MAKKRTKAQAARRRAALFSEWLHTARKEQRLTAKALAEALDIKRSFLSMIENGRRKPSFDMVLRLADALGMDPRSALQAALREHLAESQRHLVPAAEGSAEATVLDLDEDFAVARSLQRRHAELEVDRVEVHVTVDAEGNVRIVRRLTGCRPNPDVAVLEVSFRDRVGLPPEPAGLGELELLCIESPAGLDYRREKVFLAEQEHRISFPHGWRTSGKRLNGLSVEYANDLEAVFRYDGEAPKGVFNYHLPFVAKSLQLSVTFPEWYEPESVEPWAWFGRARHSVVARNVQSDGVARSIRPWIQANKVQLTVNEPLAGYSYAVVWVPPDRQKVIQAKSLRAAPKLAPRKASRAKLAKAKSKQR